MRRTSLRTVSTTFIAAALLFSQPVSAHFYLQSPPSWNSQDILGSPQKLGPCGSEPGGTPTGVVTAYHPGDTVTITFRETIFHPGHYRVALAVHDRSEFPAEPVVTPGTGTPCGTAAIMNPPVFPVLADGVLPHTSPFSGMQTITVTIPSNVTCEHCTLQILEFMAQHPLNNPGGCFYHHCADISVSVASADAGTTVTDAGTAPADVSTTPTDTGATATDTGTVPADLGNVTDTGIAATDTGAVVDVGTAPRDTGTATSGGTASGCGCRTAGAGSTSTPGALLALGLCAALRHRRAR